MAALHELATSFGTQVASQLLDCQSAASSWHCVWPASQADASFLGLAKLDQLPSSFPDPVQSALVASVAPHGVVATVVLQLRLSIVAILLQVSLWNVRLLLLGLPCMR